MFIVFEGIDGSGKTTIAKQLYQYIKSKNISNVIYTHEPTNFIKPILKETTNAYSRLLSFFVDRIEHNNLIKLYLNKGYYIICDRYLLSTFVYAHVLHGIDLKWLSELYRKLNIEINSYINIENLYIFDNKLMETPNITVFIKADKEVIIERLSNKKELDFIEQKLLNNSELIDKIQDTYAELIKNIDIYIPGYNSQFIYIENNNTSNINEIKKELYKKIFYE